MLSPIFPTGSGGICSDVPGYRLKGLFFVKFDKIRCFWGFSIMNSRWVASNDRPLSGEMLRLMRLKRHKGWGRHPPATMWSGGSVRL